MDQIDFDRILSAELSRQACEKTYTNNPLDADNLHIWGTALLELSQCHSGDESTAMIDGSISKLEEALRIEPRKAKTLFAMGNARMARGFFVPDPVQAKVHFDQAAEYILQAVEEDPGNDEYLNGLGLAAKAPSVHLEFRKHVNNQQAFDGGSSKPKVAFQGSRKKQSSKKHQHQHHKKGSDMTYDVLGWVILAAGVCAWMVFGENRPPPSESSW